MKHRILFRHLPLALLALVTYGSLIAMQSTDTPAQEPVRERDACLECHEDMGGSLAWTSHALNLDADMSQTQIACTDCHGSDSRHWEDDPEAYPMTLPSALNVSAEAAVCGSCHMNSHQQNMLERNAHAASEINCSGCHSVHSGLKEATLLKEAQPTLCYGCHQSVEGDFARSSRHPVNDGIVNCTECHMQLDETRVELSHNGTNVCTSCHAEFQGPFPYQHPATMDFATEEGGCLACHAPHGSDHPRMLQQPYEAPHFQLCTQCHAIPPGHSSNPQHGTRWMGLSCNTCHADIHGSYTSRFFLSESLAAEGCLNAGCHGR